jgi:hypothetical protein
LTGRNNDAKKCAKVSLEVHTNFGHEFTSLAILIVMTHWRPTIATFWCNISQRFTGICGKNLTMKMMKNPAEMPLQIVIGMCEQ